MRHVIQRTATRGKCGFATTGSPQWLQQKETTKIIIIFFKGNEKFGYAEIQLTTQVQYPFGLYSYESTHKGFQQTQTVGEATTITIVSGYAESIRYV